MRVFTKKKPYINILQIFCEEFYHYFNLGFNVVITMISNSILFNKISIFMAQYLLIIIFIK